MELRKEPPYLQKPTVDKADFRSDIEMPFGLTAEPIEAAIIDVYETLWVINNGLVARNLPRLEETVLGNSFSGFLSEVIVKGLGKHCGSLARNVKIGGHPDLIPARRYPGNAVLKGEGIEVKTSIQTGGWQGHNPEAVWIMIFQYAIDITTQPIEARQPSAFTKVMIAHLELEDWSFSGRKGQSRRTPTASILRSGVQKLLANAVYQQGRASAHP